MHILYLKTDLHNKPLIAGGSVSHMLGVVQGFIELGHTIDIATTIMLSELTTLPLITLYHLQMPSWLKFLRWKFNCLFSTFFFLLPTWKLVRKNRPAFIYQRYSPFNFTGILLSKLTKIPVIIEYNGSETWALELWGKKSKRNIGIRIMKRCEDLVLHNASKIVVVSEVLQDQLLNLKLPSSKIIVAPNGVNTQFFDPQLCAPISYAIPTGLFPSRPFVLGFIGTFGPWHGIELLANLIIKTEQNKQNIHFLLIGDGTLTSWLKDELSAQKISTHRYTFTGTVNAEKARHYLAVCDAFICPTQPNADGSRFFGSPTKLFEYLSLGKPVIASNLEQLTDIVSPAFFIDTTSTINIVTNQVGFLVGPTDTDAYVRALTLLYDMPLDQKNRMGFNARQKAVENYTWVKHVEKILMSGL